MQLQKGGKSNPKTAQLLKKCAAPKNTIVKKIWNPSGGQEMAVILG